MENMVELVKKAAIATRDHQGEGLTPITPWQGLSQYVFTSTSNAVNDIKIQNWTNLNNIYEGMLAQREQLVKTGTRALSSLPKVGNVIGKFNSAMGNIAQYSREAMNDIGLKAVEAMQAIKTGSLHVINLPQTILKKAVHGADDISSIVSDYVRDNPYVAIGVVLAVVTAAGIVYYVYRNRNGNNELSQITEEEFIKELLRRKKILIAALTENPDEEKERLNVIIGELKRQMELSITDLDERRALLDAEVTTKIEAGIERSRNRINTIEKHLSEFDNLGKELTGIESKIASFSNERIQRIEPLVEEEIRKKKEEKIAEGAAIVAQAQREAEAQLDTSAPFGAWVRDYRGARIKRISTLMPSYVILNGNKLYYWANPKFKNFSGEEPVRQDTGFKQLLHIGENGEYFAQVFTVNSSTVSDSVSSDGIKKININHDAGSLELYSMNKNKNGDIDKLHQLISKTSSGGMKQRTMRRKHKCSNRRRASKINRRASKRHRVLRSRRIRKMKLF
jgi:ElaB/YqjD/DUF883 family membrane-anchored ribosome-binding protein